MARPKKELGKRKYQFQVYLKIEDAEALSAKYGSLTAAIESLIEKPDSVQPPPVAAEPSVIAKAQVKIPPGVDKSCSICERYDPDCPRCRRRNGWQP